MGSTGCLICLGLSHILHLVSTVHELHDFICCADHFLGQLVYVDALLNALAHVQILVGWRDQVIHTLVVDLKQTGTRTGHW